MGFLQFFSPPREYERPLFKYKDYYYSTGRYEFPVVHSVEEALKTSPPPIPDLSAMRENVAKLFPKDLWMKD